LVEGLKTVKDAIRRNLAAFVITTNFTRGLSEEGIAEGVDEYLKTPVRYDEDTYPLKKKRA
jgi:hypothetical protein